MLEEAFYKEKLAFVKPRYNSPFLGSKKELCAPEEGGAHNSFKGGDAYSFHVCLFVKKGDNEYFAPLLDLDWFLLDFLYLLTTNPNV